MEMKIPNGWKINKSICWYLKNLKSNVINFLTWNKSTPDHIDNNWKFCIMQIVENNISK